MNGAVEIGGSVGVLLSGAFVYWEVGRFAAPQVPQSLFDERKELFAYTAGLFVGVPFAVLYFFLLTAVANGAFISAVLDLAVLAAATEGAQWALQRSAYFGRAEATPLYALGFRAATGGIVVIAAIAAYLGRPSIDALGLAVVAAQALGLVALQVGGALLSLPRAAWVPGARGGAVSGAAVGVAAYGLLVLGPTAGPVAGLVAALIVLAGEAFVYRNLRRSILDPRRVPPATPPATPGDEKGFGRTDR